MSKAADIAAKVLGKNYGKAAELKPIGNAPFFFGSLGLIYGVEGSGKSWQTAQLIGESSGEDDVLKFYFDADGSNGVKFKQHCEFYGMTYINFNGVKEYKSVKGVKHSVDNSVVGVMEIAKQIVMRASKEKKRVVIVIDSLTSLAEGTNINNAETISPIMYELDGVAQSFQCSVILIDHSTAKLSDDMKKVIGFKLEGNAGAKRRATTSTVRYEPLKPTKPQAGGIFTVERSRDSSSVPVGKKFEIKGATL